MKKKVELVVRIDGTESFYRLPDLDDRIPPGIHVFNGLDATVEAI